MSALVKFVASYVGLSIFLGVIWAVSLYPDLPSTAAQWFFIFVLALPLQLVLELAGHFVWNNRATHSIEERTAHKSISLLRIVYGLVLLLLCAGVLAGAGWAWRAVRPLLSV
jgi:hypothetical protein